jgi:hypothetical protein
LYIFGASFVFSGDIILQKRKRKMCTKPNSSSISIITIITIITEEYGAVLDQRVEYGQGCLAVYILDNVKNTEASITDLILIFSK